MLGKGMVTLLWKEDGIILALTGIIDTLITKSMYVDSAYTEEFLRD